MNFPLYLRTVCHLRFVQMWNRLWRRRPVSVAVPATTPYLSRVEPRVSFPACGNSWNGLASFCFLNERHQCSSAVDWNVPDRSKLWLYNLHYFDFLRQADRGTTATENAIVLRWIRENPVGAGNGWEPYPTSLRAVNWVKWAIGGGWAGDEFRKSLATQMRLLEKRLEYHLLANHLLANAKALVFAGSFFSGDEARRWREKGLAIFRRELAAQILPDGVHFERSAMYHSIVLEDLLDLFNLTGLDLFADNAARMLVALDMLTGPDGTIVKFNDAADGIALDPSALKEYAARLGILPAPAAPSSDSSSGFLRMESDDWTLVAKTGAIGPRYQPGHAHADKGTFELWRGSRKIVSDTGTSTYAIGAIRSYERSTAAHNVVEIDGWNSAEVWASHRVGRFDAYAPIRVDRCFSLSPYALAVADEISGSGRHDLSLRVHLAPGVAEGEVDLVADCGAFEFEDCEIGVEFGRRVPSRCAVLRIPDAELPFRISWRLGVKHQPRTEA